MQQMRSQEQEDQEQKLQTYLNALEKPLASQTEEVQREWRSEAESHLRSIIAAQEETGSSHEEAVAAALQRFGDARRVARRMRLELFLQAERRFLARWRMQRERERRRPYAPLVNLLTIQLVLTQTLFAAWIEIYLSYTNSPVAQMLARRGVEALTILIPAVIGWLFGRRGAQIWERLSPEERSGNRWIRAYFWWMPIVTAIIGGGKWFYMHTLLDEQREMQMIQHLPPRQQISLWENQFDPFAPGYMWSHTCLLALCGLLLFLGGVAAGWLSRQRNTVSMAKA